MTLSADSTSRRKQNYESRHIALQVPDYAELKNSIHVKPASYHRVCFFVIEATNDHSSQGSVNGWKSNAEELTSLFNCSPLAQRLNRQFSIRDFLGVIFGWNGDHASGKKASARGM